MLCGIWNQWPKPNVRDYHVKIEHVESINKIYMYNFNNEISKIHKYTVAFLCIFVTCIYRKLNSAASFDFISLMKN